MKKNLEIKLILILSLLLTSCGFKKINKKDSQLVYLQSIDVTGERRIAYTLKNNISLISNENSKNKYTARIETKIEKTNKIKDKTGKVTRYDLSATANLELENLNNKRKIQKIFVRSGDYDVAQIYSDTINNERNLIRNITQQISDDIINFITLLVRD